MAEDLVQYQKSDWSTLEESESTLSEDQVLSDGEDSGIVSITCVDSNCVSENEQGKLHQWRDRSVGLSGGRFNSLECLQFTPGQNPERLGMVFGESLLDNAVPKPPDVDFGSRSTIFCLNIVTFDSCP
ncbi:YALIA101S04e10286g1_1 [Yarrowia lipolytica]|nr:YALIA101S04e10286g1_1 [Yarrowia lipolytica]